MLEIITTILLRTINLAYNQLYCKLKYQPTAQPETTGFFNRKILLRKYIIPTALKMMNVMFGNGFYHLSVWFEIKVI